MVKITRLIIEANDLIAFRVKCSQCKGEVLLAVASMLQSLPKACPACGDGWGFSTDYWKTVQATLSNLRLLHKISAEQEGGTIPFTVGMELDGEAAEKCNG